jgi:thiol:disulfide interchange protein DsbD
MGERDVLRPVPLRNLTTLAAGTTATAASAPADQTFQRYGRLADIDAALARAKSAGRPVLIDFYASWCTDCVRMEKTTFVDARVREAFQRFTLVQADVTNNDAASSAIKQRFGVFGPPAMLILGADGTEQKELRVYGFRTVDELLALLGRV